MYHECAEGGLCSEWFIPTKERMGYREFRLRMSEQMLTYSATKRVYPGDEYCRAWTRKTQKQREPAKRKAPPLTNTALVNAQMASSFKKAKLETRLIKPRLCGDLGAFEKHAGSMTKTQHNAACEICGKETRYLCGLCNKHLCCYSDQIDSIVQEHGR